LGPNQGEENAGAAVSRGMTGISIAEALLVCEKRLSKAAAAFAPPR
jgi:hypothetical protein